MSDAQAAVVFRTVVVVPTMLVLDTTHIPRVPKYVRRVPEADAYHHLPSSANHPYQRSTDNNYSGVWKKGRSPSPLSCTLKISSTSVRIREL